MVERSKTAERFLNQNSHLYSGELEILAIGPLTNIAKAILGDSGFVSRVKRLYLKGGLYWLDYSEHNIECDNVAARIVFDSGIPVTAIGLDVTPAGRDDALIAARKLLNGRCASVYGIEARHVRC